MASNTYSLKAVLSATDRISPALKKVDSHIGKIGRSFSALGKSCGSLAAKVALPVTALTGLGSFSLKGALNQFISLGDGIDKAAKKAGVGVESLQQLRQAAKAGGMSTEAMDAALAKLTYNMGQAASGKNKELASLFSHLGISLKDSNGKVRDASDVMRNLAESIKNNEDPAARLQILTLAFGQNMAKDLIPVLEGGASELDRLGQRAKDLGIVMDQEAASKAAHLSDVMGEFKDVCTGASNSIGATLAPVLEKVVTRIQGWIVQNKDLIAQRLEQIFQKIAETLDKIDFDAVVKGVFDFVESCGKLIDKIGGVDTILKALAVFLGGSLLGTFADVGKNIITLGTTLTTAFGPWGMLIAGLVTAGLMLWKNWDKICAWFTSTFPGVTEILKALPDTFKAAWEAASKIIFGIWDNLLKTWETVKGIFTDPVGTLKKAAKSAGDFVKDFFGFGGDKAKDEKKGAAEPQNPKAAAAPAPLSGAAPSAAGPQQKVGGEISIKVYSDDDTDAEIMGVENTGDAGVNIYSYTGDER